MHYYRLFFFWVHFYLSVSNLIWCLFFFWYSGSVLLLLKSLWWDYNRMTPKWVEVCVEVAKMEKKSYICSLFSRVLSVMAQFNSHYAAAESWDEARVGVCVASKLVYSSCYSNQLLHFCFFFSFFFNFLSATCFWGEKKNHTRISIIFCIAI